MKTITAIFLSFFSLIIISGTSHAFTATGFSNPYGIVIDQKSGLIYVSNVNGDPEGKDDNGFISRLKGDGTVDQVKFIDGAQQDVILHAPKGMVVLGNLLYVCDIDQLHAFEINSGRQLFDVNFGELPHKHFYSIVVGPDGALYVTDAVINAIYRIDVAKQHEVTLFASGEDLGAPHGIAWYSASQNFLVAGGGSGQVVALDRSGKRQQTPAVFLKTLEGIDIDDSGGIYVSSRDLSSVYRLSPIFAVFGFQTGLSAPAGVVYNRVDKSVIVAMFNGNSVQSFPLKQ